MFKDHPGQQRVAQNEYEIVDASGNIIEEPEWESEVTPGARISMGIIIPIPTRRPTIAGSLATACPRCNTGNPGAVSVRGATRWFVSHFALVFFFRLLSCADRFCVHDSRNCYLLFRNIDTERIVEEWTEPAPEGSPKGSPEVVTGDSLIPAGRGSQREEDNFRRIQYRREVFNYPGCGSWLKYDNNLKW